MRVGVWCLVLGACGSGPEDLSLSDTSSSISQQPAISTFLVYAEQTVSLGDHTSVAGGNVGVTLQTESTLGAQVVLGEHSSDSGDLYGPSVTLGSGSVVHDVATLSLISNGSVVHSVSTFDSNLMPKLPLAHPVPVGSAAVVVSGSMTLQPGSYGALSGAGVLSLTPGQYSFSSVALGSHTVISASTGTTVYVSGHFALGDNSVISSTYASGLKIVAGAGDDPSAAMTIGSHAAIRALLAAPHGTVNVGSNAALVGAVAAFAVVTGAHSSLQFQNGFDAEQPSDLGSQPLSGYAGSMADGRLYPIVEALPRDIEVSLSVGLPVRDRSGLDAFIADVTNPASPNFRNYMTATTFAQNYAPLASDYSLLQAWATVNNLQIKHSFPDNTLLSVSGAAADVEAALHANLVARRTHDVNGTPFEFVAVDREPSINLGPQVLWISGLTNYVVPHSSMTSSPDGGSLSAVDIRNAYLGIQTSCQALDGTDQTVGILSLEPFNHADLQNWLATANTPVFRSDWPQPDINNLFYEGLVPPGSGLADDGEASLDIEMIWSVAPKARIIFYEGDASRKRGLDVLSFDNADDIFAAMANDPRIGVVSNSYTFGRSSNSAQSLAELASKGVSVFTNSGDFGDVNDPDNNLNMEFQTLVGGTTISTNDVAQVGSGWTYCGGNTSDPYCYYDGEETWNETSHMGASSKDATGGGIMDGTGAHFGCDCFPEPFCCEGTPIPGYQNPDMMVPVAQGGNGGSKIWRNYPDVSAVANSVSAQQDGFTTIARGTSASTPVWAGIAALVNQYATTHSSHRLGFANPALYAMANDPTLYSQVFNDPHGGLSNYNIIDPKGNGFPSVVGYDLATGLGTPTCALIQQLGTQNPTTPQTYSQILVHVANGHDGVDDDSSVVLDVLGLDGSLIRSLVLKQPNEIGWADIGAEHDKVLALPPLSPADIGDVKLRLVGSGDAWDVTGLEVFLIGSNVPYACVADISGDASCDLSEPGCGTGGQLVDGHFGLMRLDDAHPEGVFNTELCQEGIDPNCDTLHFHANGCPAWGGVATVSTYDQLEFVIDTGNDDLESDSELRVDLYDAANNLLEEGVLHHGGSLSYDDQSQWSVRYNLATPRSAGEIASVSVTVVAGNDEWHVQAIDVYALSSATPWAYVCLAQGEEVAADRPEYDFDTGAGRSTSPVAPLACP